MKKLILILISFLAMNQSYPYWYENYGPDTIQTINVCIFNSQDYGIICSHYGMYLVQGYDGEVLEYFPVPAKDAIQLNNDTIIFVAGDGSYSDGIYSLDLQTYQSDVIHNCINPNFIRYYEDGGVYYVGFETGLLKSEDGLTWEEIDYFSGMNCIGMEYYSEHIIINVSADVTHLFLSDDNGGTWFESSNNPGGITNMEFTYPGVLYGIFPDNSYSSGLWSSTDYGYTWEIELYSVYMSDVCIVPVHNDIFLSWKSNGGQEEGVAKYYSGIQELQFFNEGLPDKEVNRIKIPTGEGPLFVCTDSGIYWTYNPFLGIDYLTKPNKSINIFPNPVKEKLSIKINLTEPETNNTSISIYNNKGGKVDEISIPNSLDKEITIEWDKGDLPSGVYYLVLKTKKETRTEKFIIL